MIADKLRPELLRLFLRYGYLCHLSESDGIEEYRVSFVGARGNNHHRLLELLKESAFAVHLTSLGGESVVSVRGFAAWDAFRALWRGSGGVQTA